MQSDNKPGRVRQLVKNGISAEQIQPQNRTSTELRGMVRELVERGIVFLHKAGQKEHLTGDDIEALSKYTRLLKELGDTDPEPDKPGQVTDSELGKALRG